MPTENNLNVKVEGDASTFVGHLDRLAESFKSLGAALGYAPIEPTAEELSQIRLWRAATKVLYAVQWLSAFAWEVFKLWACCLALVLMTVAALVLIATMQGNLP